MPPLTGLLFDNIIIIAFATIVSPAGGGLEGSYGFDLVSDLSLCSDGYSFGGVKDFQFWAFSYFAFGGLAFGKMSNVKS
ncbi:hypothetical protein MASR2M44_27230 [Bacteroidota bacterium]